MSFISRLQLFSNFIFLSPPTLPSRIRMRNPGHGLGYVYGYEIRTRSEIPHRWQSTRLFIQPWDAINIHRRRAQIWDDFDARHAGCPSRCAVSPAARKPPGPGFLYSWVSGSPCNRIIPFPYPIPVPRETVRFDCLPQRAVWGECPTSSSFPGSRAEVFHISDIRADLLVWHWTQEGLCSYMSGIKGSKKFI